MSERGAQTVNGIEERIEAYGRALKAPEVAKLFGVTPEAIYKAAKMGTIPSFRINTSVRFDPKELVRWYRRNRIG